MKAKQKISRPRAGRATAPLRRVGNWPAVLDCFIEEKRSQPFDWRLNNCAFFAADWICVLTGGEDPAKRFRARVKSAASAARVLRAAGGLEKITADYCAAHGWPEIAPAFAQRGDIGMVDTPEGRAVGVIIGRFVAHAGAHGLVFVPRAKLQLTWRIG